MCSLAVFESCSLVLFERAGERECEREQGADKRAASECVWVVTGRIEACTF